MDNLSVQTLKGYEIRNRIGEGSFGAVYRAYQPSVDREVAIKVILPQYANQPDFIRRFEVEAQLVARLEHPHIVPLYDYWRDPDGAYLVMRYLRGGSLKDWIGQGALNPRDALCLIEQIAQALALAHHHKVVHRDIKPSNILLDTEHNAYLADFGFAKVLGGEPSVEGLRGTLDYISPEQIRSQPVTSRTDIYALGIVLYEMLAGTRPFSPSPSAAALLKKHLESPVPDVSMKHDGLPEAVNDVIQTATAKEPADRYTDAPEMAGALREALAVVEAVPLVVEPPPLLVESLTNRELEVLQLMAQGLSNGEIASRLVIAPNTARWYVQEIYGKLGTSNRRQAVARAQRGGLLPPLSDGMPVGPVGENPYKGLRVFQEPDALEFFGRETLVERLLVRLAENVPMNRFLAVVGPSGSGKSSVVKAGLIPALRQGRLGGASEWFMAEMQPGPYPLDELEMALLSKGVSPQQPGAIMEQLQRDERGLLRAARLTLPENGELFLVIDQFEELFTQTEDLAVARHILGLIYTAVNEPRSRVRVVATLRADFYDRPLMYPDFCELIRHRTEVVVPLTPDELEQAIVKPAEMAGVTVEPGLVVALVAEVHEQPGTLPLLEYALTELFERRQGRTMTLAAYQTIGGALGALTRQADEVYEDLSDDDQDMARQGFLRLVTLGEGTEDVRRRVLLSELRAVNAQRNGMKDVLDLFGEYRLLTFDRDPVTREPTVEVAHEALIQRWERLRGWIDASRADIRQQRLLGAAAVEWEQAGLERSYLLTGSRLAQFEDWAAHTDIALTPDEREFLQASISEREHEAEIERDRQAHEMALKQRIQRVIQILAAVFLVAALAGIGLAIFAIDREQQAQDARTKAETNLFQAWDTQALFLADLSEKQHDLGDKRRAILLAEEGLAHYAEGIHHPENYQALLDALSAPGLEQLYLPHDAPLGGATWNADETRLLTWSDDGSARVWDAASGDNLLTLPHDGAVSGAQWNANETRILTWSKDTTARVWDAASGENLLTLPHTDPVLGAVWREDQGRILTWAGYTVSVWDAVSGNRLLTLSHEDRVQGAAWNQDATRILTWSDDFTVRVWDAATGANQLTLRHDAKALGAMWNADETRILTWSEDSTARVWDAATGQALLPPLNHDDPVTGARWNADETRILTWSWDDTARVWDATTGNNLLILRHSGNVNGAIWNADETRILTWSEDTFARVWDARRGSILQALPHDGSVKGAAWNQSETRILTWSQDGTARVWDTASRSELLAVRHDNSTKGVSGATWNRSETRILTWSGDHTARTWDVTGGEGVQVMRHDDAVQGAVWSPDEMHLLTWSWDDTARVWDTASGALLHTLPHEDRLKGAAWTKDGSRILTWTGAAVRIWDAASGDLLHEYYAQQRVSDVIMYAAWNADESAIWVWLGNYSISGQEWDVNSGNILVEIPNVGIPQAWSADETRLLSRSSMNVFVWDIATQKTLLTLRHDRGVSGARWNADETRILTWAGSTARVWDAASGEVILTLTHQSDVSIAAWNADETQILTAAGDRVQVWDAHSGALLFALPVPTGPVAGALWSPDETHILAWGQDQVWVWDVAHQELLLTLTHTAPVLGAAWSQDGTQIVSWSGSTAQLWIIAPDRLMALAAQLQIRPLSDAEREQFFLPALASTGSAPP
jgi:WD40 repeat protein/DNA-binding CsgD family transcriptional regulator